MFIGTVPTNLPHQWSPANATSCAQPDCLQQLAKDKIAGDLRVSRFARCRFLAQNRPTGLVSEPEGAQGIQNVVGPTDGFSSGGEILARGASHMPTH